MNTTPASASAAASPRKPLGFVIELKKIVFLDDLPKTQTGKVNKKALVAAASEAISD